jgi:NCAIR mutase (PurE)-related protein
VIFGQGKTREQTVGIFERLIARSPNVLITRTNAETYGEIRNVSTDAEWHEAARLIRVWRDKEELGTGEIAVVTAGTSDIPVAEEAALVAETMGNRVKRIWDAGVAGIHRILSEREVLQSSRVVSRRRRNGRRAAVGRRRTGESSGYRRADEHRLRRVVRRRRRALGMLNSCASNVTVVNIDNGFGAGFVASLINRRRKEDIDH